MEAGCASNAKRHRLFNLGIELSGPARPTMPGFRENGRYESGEHIESRRISEFIHQLVAMLLRIDAGVLLDASRRPQTMRMFNALVEATKTQDCMHTRLI